MKINNSKEISINPFFITQKYANIKTFHSSPFNGQRKKMD